MCVFYKRKIRNKTSPTTLECSQSISTNTPIYKRENLICSPHTWRTTFGILVSFQRTTEKSSYQNENIQQQGQAHKPAPTDKK